MRGWAPTKGAASTHGPSRTALDIEGQVLSVRDALGTDLSGGSTGRECAASIHSVSGLPIRSFHIDFGEGFALSELMGRRSTPGMRSAIASGPRVDALRRPTHLWVQRGTDPEWLSLAPASEKTPA